MDDLFDLFLKVWRKSGLILYSLRLFLQEKYRKIIIINYEVDSLSITLSLLSQTPNHLKEPLRIRVRLNLGEIILYLKKLNCKHQFYEYRGRKHTLSIKIEKCSLNRICLKQFSF